MGSQTNKINSVGKDAEHTRIRKSIGFVVPGLIYAFTCKNGYPIWHRRALKETQYPISDEKRGSQFFQVFFFGAVFCVSLSIQKSYVMWNWIFRRKYRKRNWVKYK